MNELKMKRIYESAGRGGRTEGERVRSAYFGRQTVAEGNQQREGSADALGERDYAITGAQKVVRA